MSFPQNQAQPVAPADGTGAGDGQTHHSPMRLLGELVGGAIAMLFGGARHGMRRRRMLWGSGRDFGDEGLSLSGRSGRSLGERSGSGTSAADIQAIIATRGAVLDEPAPASDSTPAATAARPGGMSVPDAAPDAPPGGPLVGPCTSTFRGEVGAGSHAAHRLELAAASKASIYAVVTNELGIDLPAFQLQASIAHGGAWGASAWVTDPDEPAVLELPAGTVDVFVLDPNGLLTSAHAVSVTISVWSGPSAAATRTAAA